MQSRAGHEDIAGVDGKCHESEDHHQRLRFKVPAHLTAPSSIGIASLVGMALVMDHSGMTYYLAQGISRSVGAAFPLFSPLIGVLGAFMTGSNTNSNVIFAPLQKQAAELIGISVFIILGAQTTGGSLGSMLAPAKIIVGASTVGADDGLVLRKLLIYGGLLLLVIAVLGFVMLQVF